MLSVLPVPCLRDNYAYLVFDSEGDGSCVIVDACEAEPILGALSVHGLSAQAILTTHHHHDHVGGNGVLTERLRIPLYAHHSEQGRILHMTHGVRHLQPFAAPGLPISVVPIHAPGHTQGAVTYVMGDIAFTGDTLFCGGCGRLKEGTAEQLYSSLTVTLAELDDDVLIYTGHEYTESNLRFAKDMWPTDAIVSRYEDVAAKRAQGMFTASATMGTERLTNIFLLTHESTLQERVLGARVTDAPSDGSALSTFTELRRRKDDY